MVHFCAVHICRLWDNTEKCQTAFSMFHPWALHISYMPLIEMRRNFILSITKLWTTKCWQRFVLYWHLSLPLCFNLVHFSRNRYSWQAFLQRIFLFLTHYCAKSIIIARDVAMKDSSFGIIAQFSGIAVHFENCSSLRDSIRCRWFFIVRPQIAEKRESIALQMTACSSYMPLKLSIRYLEKSILK